MTLRRSIIFACTFAALAGASLVLHAPTGAEAGNPDPQGLVERFFDELNAGDAQGAAALVTEDFVLTDIDGGSFAAVGRVAFELVLVDTVDANAEVTLTDLDVNGNTVTGVVEWRDDTTDELNIDRYLQPFTIMTEDTGLISRGDFTYDETDAETREYLDAPDSDDGVDDGPPPMEFALAAQPGGNQPGTASIFTDDPAVSGIFLDITPGPAGVQQPAHFHTGTCAAPGPIIEPLANVIDGESFTLLSATVDDLVDSGLIINVHKSVAEPAIYVSCGAVLSASAATPTAAAGSPAPAVPTATPPAGIVAPSTGTGGGTDQSGVPFWMYGTLAVASISVALAGGALRMVRSRGR